MEYLFSLLMMLAGPCGNALPEGPNAPRVPQSSSREVFPFSLLYRKQLRAAVQAPLERWVYLSPAGITSAQPDERAEPRPAFYTLLRLEDPTDFFLAIRC